MTCCSKCGKELSGAGVCSCEETINTKAIKDDCLNVLKKTFSPKPDDAVAEAINSKSHIWAVFGVAT